MGLPGAGKTTLKRQRMRRGALNIEPDKLKSRHRRYSSDMSDETDLEVHRWSVRRAVEAFNNAISSKRRQDVVFDTSGSNSRWLRERIVSARRAGYYTELLWVNVPVEIALLRNRDRAAFDQRRTMVPESVILDKVKDILASYEKLRVEVDKAEQIDNWEEHGDEIQTALRDLYLYPAPRTRPPHLRPGDRKYGDGPDGARSPSRSKGSRRKVLVGPWKRNDETMARKNQRFDWMDRVYKGDRERFALEEVLGNCEINLEPNRYPYQMPPGIEHWTIWRRTRMAHEELCEYVESWLDAQKKWHNVISWNYDDNLGKKTINIWHVHVYFQGGNGQGPNLRRGVEIAFPTRSSRYRSMASTRVPSSPSRSSVRSSSWR